ncbi:hypothetical protein T459_09929 [Capsicum annuum]|uniref:GRF-type domain-containing protein n=1 Tax=Capsicum annuum TaxID=4072 RepID=A0A2G3A0Q9_CAPAN|nr:hypothetical protein T459_09929 [Capsicum annuum]
MRMSKNSVNIDVPDLCYCSEFCPLRTSRTPSNSGRRFVGCKVSKENGGYEYFRWIDPKPSISVHQYPEVESSLMIRCKDGENSCDRLKQKLKDVEQERDTLCEKLKDSEGKLIALRQKLKKVKLERECAKLKLNRLVLLLLIILTVKWFFNMV